MPDETVEVSEISSRDMSLHGKKIKEERYVG